MGTANTSMPIHLDGDVPTTAPCTACGEVVGVDEDLRLRPHLLGGLSGQDCGAAGERAGWYPDVPFRHRPRGVRGVEPTETPGVTFQIPEAWKTQLRCNRCPKTHTLPVATFEPVLLPEHSRRGRDGGRECCPGSGWPAGRQMLIGQDIGRASAVRAWSIGIGLLVAALLLLNSCFGGREGAEPESSGGGSSIAVPRPDVASDPMRDKPSSPYRDTSISDYVAASGVGDGLIMQLGEVAGSTGYALQRGVPLSREQAESFAVVIIDQCRELNAGALTVDQMVAQHVSEGAPPADARAMAAFMTQTFCPAVQ